MRGVERALSCGNLCGPVGWGRDRIRDRDAARIGGWLRGVLVRRVLTATIEFMGAVTVLGDDLIQPVVQPSHGIGEMLGALVGLGDCVGIRVSMGHAFEVPRQRFETLLDSGEFSANGVIVAVWSGI
jgi:hypothetical protein